MSDLWCIHMAQTIVTVSSFLILVVSTVYLILCMGTKYMSENELVSNRSSCLLQANASACITYLRSQNTSKYFQQDMCKALSKVVSFTMSL